jgi:hypothetical protein
MFKDGEQKRNVLNALNTLVEEGEAPVSIKELDDPEVQALLQNTAVELLVNYLKDGGDDGNHLEWIFVHRESKKS